MRCIGFMQSISQIWGILNPRIRGLAMQRISDKKRGTDKVKLSFSTFRLDGEQSPDLSPKLSRLLLDDNASSESALAKTAFAYAVTWPSRARESVGLTNHKNKRKRQPVDSADAPNMFEFFDCCK